MQVPSDKSGRGHFGQVGKLRRKQRRIRIVGTLIAATTAGLIPVLFPRLTFADAFLNILLGTALAVAVMTGTWVILVHGDLKQRSDYTVGVTLALVLFGLVGLANWLYEEDWIWARTCAAEPNAYPDKCSDPATTFRQEHNAAKLDLIYGVLAVGQLIPLLSIFKDAVYSWRRPTHWLAISTEFTDAKMVRRANLRLSSFRSSTVAD